jgi:RNA polymerase sigma-70 factor (ECF subfamily)
VSSAAEDAVARAVADAHRGQWTFVLAATARVTRDLDLAEECVQDAYVRALHNWARDGIPASPGAWLTTTARNKAVDAPDELEVCGLLALLLVTDARRRTRTDPDGRLLLLEEQDRSSWDRTAIAEGRRLVAKAMRVNNPGRFTLQAAIAAHHAAAPSYADTDWPEVVKLYDALLAAWPSPVVALNRTIALARVEGPQAALDVVESLERDARLATYRYLPAVKADLLRRLGRVADAAQAYRTALGLADNSAERAFLTTRIAELTDS